MVLVAARTVNALGAVLVATSKVDLSAVLPVEVPAASHMSLAAPAEGSGAARSHRRQRPVKAVAGELEAQPQGVATHKKAMDAVTNVQDVLAGARKETSGERNCPPVRLQTGMGTQGMVERC